MKSRVIEWIKENNLINPGDDVVCAVSGGVDSMVLLHILHSLEKELCIRVFAAHFNHCIRGAESDRDEDFVRRYCEIMNVPFYRGNGDVLGRALETGESVEEAARYLRYEFLHRVGDGAKIATAHHANDNLETMLMKLIRGCGPTGICGIPPMRGNIIRPLLCLSRQEIIEYAENNAICHVEDSTNNCDDYLRNRIRHNIIPLLTAENVNVTKNSVEVASMLREDDELLRSLAKTNLNLSQIKDGYSCFKIRQMVNPIKTRVIKLILEKYNIEYSVKTITSIISAIDSNKSNYKIDIAGDYYIEIIRDCIYIRNKQDRLNKQDFDIDITECGEYNLGNVKCNVSVNHNSTKFDKDAFHLYITKNSIDGNLHIRNKMNGDSIKLPGGTKTITRAIKDKEFLNFSRDMYPVICDNSGVIAVPSVGVDIKHRVDKDNPCDVYCITFENID